MKENIEDGSPLDEVSNLYREDLHHQWAEKKTMEHASGIWGREQMLRYLQSEVVKEGDIVVDLGSGAGYPSFRISEMVGKEGKVIGVEKNKTMLGLEGQQLPLTNKYKEIENLKFINADVTKLPLEDESADVVVSFMLLHNLELSKIQETFKEVARVLKSGGKAVFLTMHSEALDQPWDLDFMNYDKQAIEKYKSSQDKEGILVKGVVKSSGGGEKEVLMINHTRENILKAIEESSLNLVDEQDIWIDEKTAKDKFGINSVRLRPTTPIFWIFTLKKN